MIERLRGLEDRERKRERERDRDYETSFIRITVYSRTDSVTAID